MEKEIQKAGLNEKRRIIAVKKAEVNVPKEDTDGMIQALRAEVRSNKAMEAICNIFALRERSREQVTISALQQTMSKEGYSFSTKEYEKALKFFASIGIGKLDYNRSGKLRALKGIKTKLQSIGLAAITKEDKLEAAINHKKFTSLPSVVVDKPSQSSPPTVHVEAAEAIHHDGTYSASLVVMIGSQQVSFPLPKKITTKELGEILSQGLTK